MGALAAVLPLPTLLSQVLVAFTIEFDNEFEHRMPHWTTNAGRAARPPGAPWLVSQVMWRPLAGVIEDRWRSRFGPDHIDRLRGSLQEILDELDLDLPRYLPVVSPTQNEKAPIPESRPPAPSAAGRTTASPLDLSVLLSQVLLTFTLDFERESMISLPICANTLRVLDESGVRVGDLPRLTGVSKEGNSAAIGFLERRGCVVTEPHPAGGRAASYASLRRV
jgi:hypothetical protein